MGVVRRSLTTEDATKLIRCTQMASRLNNARSVQRTHPSFKRKMKRLFVSLPIVLSFERIGAEGTLEGKDFCSKQLRFLALVPARAPFAWSAREFQRALGSRGRVVGEITGMRSSHTTCRRGVVGRLPGIATYKARCVSPTPVCSQPLGAIHKIGTRLVWD
jgi:hypothetical protein